MYLGEGKSSEKHVPLGDERVRDFMMLVPIFMHHLLQASLYLYLEPRYFTYNGPRKPNSLNEINNPISSSLFPIWSWRDTHIWRAYEFRNILPNSLFFRHIKEKSQHNFVFVAELVKYLHFKNKFQNVLHYLYPFIFQEILYLSTSYISQFIM